MAKQILQKVDMGDVRAYVLQKETTLACIDGESVLKTIVMKMVEVKRKKYRAELVDRLIEQATDDRALSSMFEGWCAWY